MSCLRGALLDDFGNTSRVSLLVTAWLHGSRCQQLTDTPHMHHTRSTRVSWMRTNVKAPAALQRSENILGPWRYALTCCCKCGSDRRGACEMRSAAGLCSSVVWRGRTLAKEPHQVKCLERLGSGRRWSRGAPSARDHAVTAARKTRPESKNEPGNKD